MAEDDSDRVSPFAGSGGAFLAATLGTVSDNPRVDALLERQTELTEIQIDSLRKQDEFELSHLRWRRFNDQMKGALQIMVVALGLAIVIGLIVAVWNASQSDGVVVGAFSVPPGFAQNGMGGDIVADDLTNKIAAIRDFADANSLAQSRHVRNDREGDIKVEIPETGVSLAQVWRYLRQWFGNERPLTGNIRTRADGKIVLTVVLDGQTFTYTGAANELDALEQRAAEQLFATFEPSNYVLYLGGKNRIAEGYAAAGRNVMLAATDLERGGAYSLWANTTAYATGDLEVAHARALMATAYAPKSTAPYMEMMNDAFSLGHDEEVLRLARFIPGQRQEDEAPSFRNRGYVYAHDLALFIAYEQVGDFARAASAPCAVFCFPAYEKVRRAEMAARQHDPQASRDLLAQARAIGVGSPSSREARARYFLAAATGDWNAAVGAARNYAAALAVDNPVPRLAATITATRATPLLAVALAHAGDIASARAAIAPTPGDCYSCLRARAVIAALQGDKPHAVFWFARAIAAAPSIPFAYADQGEMLLRHAEFDAAIAQFDLAHRKGPNFADPLEMWGEALVAKNRSDLALAKFEEAAHHAPNWGRLHLKWGEALLWLGRKDDARKQFNTAAGLYLSPTERGELARMNLGGHA